MKYAFNTAMYTHLNGWIPSYSIDETMRRIKNIGYDAIELPCAAPYALPSFLDTKDKINEMNMLQNKYELPIMALMPVPGGAFGGNFSSPYDCIRNWTVQYAKDCIDLAKHWNVNQLTFVPGWAEYGTRLKEARKYCENSLKEVAVYALETLPELYICVENIPDASNILETVDDTLELIEEVNMPNIGIVIDINHAIYRKEDPSDWVYLSKEYLKNIHFSDYNRLPPGKGGFDFIPVLKALKNINYQGYIDVEIGFGRDVYADSMARQAIEYLKGLEES